jgi:hypothetical protein
MLLARAEAEAVGVRFVNQHLHERFPNRTLEAIKGLRKKDAYKEMVKEAMMARLLAQVNPTHQPRPTTV